MSKTKKTTKKYNNVPNPAIEKFEKMFKEIGVQPNNAEDAFKKEPSPPDWIISGTDSSPKRFV